MKPEVFVTPPTTKPTVAPGAEVEENWDAFGDDSSLFDADEDRSETAMAHVSESDFAISSNPTPPPSSKTAQIDFSSFFASSDSSARDSVVDAPQTAAPVGATVIEPEVLPRDSRPVISGGNAIVRSRETPVPVLRFSPFPVRPKGPWQAVWLVTSPLLVAMLALTVVFAATRVNPERFGKMIMGLVPDVFGPRGPKLPPTSLLIKRGEMVKLSLVEGDQIPLIFGRVLNSGTAPVGGVLVEGAILDSEGRLLASKRVKVGNELSRESRDGISREVALRLESTTRSKRNRIEPGESSDFALVFEDLPASVEPRYFSTRVYSVE
jgi:hypothetical protein